MSNHAVCESGSLGGLEQEFTRLFTSRGVSRPATEARDLIAAVLDRPRFWSSLHAESLPDEATRQRLRNAAQRRAAGAPFAYAVGSAAFRYLTLEVDERVLIPRPETEQLVDIVLRWARPGQVVADIGTGSGAIALALASEGRFRRVLATDVCSDALELARRNAAMHAESLTAELEFRAGRGLAPLRSECVDVIVSNPPYIAPHEMRELPRLVRDWEPAQALTCANDGLEVTEAIIEGAPQRLTPGGLLALEVDCRRAQRVADAAASTGAYRNISVRRDAAGRDRFLVANTRDSA